MINYGYNNGRNGRGNTNGCGTSRGGCGNGNGREGGRDTMRALVPCIIDSCRECEQLTQTFTLAELPAFVGGCDDELTIGTVIPVRQCGDLTVEVLNTERSFDDIATTVLLSVPIAFMQCTGCAATPYSRTAVTEVKTFALCGSEFSTFELLGSDVQSLTAVVTEIDETTGLLRVTVSMIVRLYVAQTVEQEVYLLTYGRVHVHTCNNGCLNNLQIAANNVTRTGFNTANNTTTTNR